MATLGIPQNTIAVLQKYNFSFQKKFGQNFLINAQARKKIIDALDIDETSKVWEVGPGLGAMTAEILSRGAELTVFEIDRGFISILKEIFSDYIDNGKLNIVEGDVLKTWKKVYQEKGIPDRFFGNLPYNISATIIADMIENKVRFEKAVVTVQKEVAMRMAAKQNTEDYSSFSILCQWAYNVKNLMDLPGGNFWPRPNVDSRTVVMSRKEEFPCCKNPDAFMKLQRALFVSRRKTVRNNLSPLFNNSEEVLKVLEEANINPMARAESLSIEQLLMLSDIINNGII